MIIPFWQQTTSFTCDPACLLMAMKALDKKVTLSRAMELEIWRESYGIGIPGCLPQGLAYSALRRGFKASIICQKEELNKIGTLAYGEEAVITTWSAQDLLKKALKLGATLLDKKLAVDDLVKALTQEAIPLVMINMQQLHHINSPHWIAVTKITKTTVAFHDPFIENGKNCQLEKEKFEQLMFDLEKTWQFPARAVLISKKNLELSDNGHTANYSKPS